MAAVDTRLFLYESRTMRQMFELDKAHQRVLTPQLNSPGKATFTMSVLEPDSAAIVEHQTAVVWQRDGLPIWSGPVYQTADQCDATNDLLTVTAMGWFQVLNQRVLHTGAEFAAMVEASGQSYFGPGVESATQLAYSATNDPTGTSFEQIVMDLLVRANIDSPTRIVPGRIFGTPQQCNLTLQQFQNVGQQITQICAYENGPDFVIDPITRVMDVYAQQGNDPHFNGYGRDRSRLVSFTFPGNCLSAGRSRDGTKTTNRVEASGQYGVGRADDLTSQQENDLLETNDTLSDVVDPNILIAYANAEVAVLREPWQIITVSPAPVTELDEDSPSVLPPVSGYWVGDVCAAVIDRGRLRVGVDSPQTVRVFGLTMSVDDNGVETISNVQTSYASASGGIQ